MTAVAVLAVGVVGVSLASVRTGLQKRSDARTWISADAPAERDAIPFCPHVRPVTGHVCLGEAWQLAEGNWLLANLVIHVMKLVNFDEPCTLDSFSQEAFDYALGALAGRPLNPDLDYPVMDERETHSGVAPDAILPGSIFRRSTGFAPRPLLVASAPPAFRRRSP
jgi:hypothetical protein